MTLSSNKKKKNEDKNHRINRERQDLQEDCDNFANVISSKFGLWSFDIPLAKCLNKKMVNKKQQNKKRFFYPPDFEKVVDYLNENGKFTALFMINTGCRIEEARGFKDNPIFDNERYNITLVKTKVRAKLKEKIPSPRTIPVSRYFFRQLKKELPTHRILSTNAFNKQLKEACVKANIKMPEQFSSHKLRKTFGTWMLSLGVDGFKLAQHLGHTPNELARDYATNDVFNSKDKQIMRSIVRDLPGRIG